MNRLYDYYQGLLTDKQRAYLDLYYREDYSLGEIAENFGVSRQAVYDNIHRSEGILKHYEAVLRLVETDDQKQHQGKDLLTYVKTHYPTDHALYERVTKFFSFDSNE